MVKREEIKNIVKEVADKNKLRRCFIPIIEEFFIRGADQLKWNKEELGDAIIRFEKVVNIKFADMYERRHIIKKYKEQSAFTSYRLKKQKISVFFDIDYLKGILEFDKEKIEEFINTAMHEFGHSIQCQKEKNKVNSGFREDRIINKYGINRVSTRDCMINELAEVINATRLENGNIENDKYLGYEEIQTAGKIILNSFGISELELADLQFQPKAREEYEKLIANKLDGIPSELYRNSFGEILDAIYKFSTDENQRDNLILQIDSLQNLSKELIEKRFNNIMINSDNTLKNFARLCIGQQEKEKALKKLFYQFNIKDSELKINSNRNPYIMLFELGYELKEIEKFHEIESEEKRKIQDQKNKQNKNHYDNEELIEKLYQSFLKYPIRKVPLKYKPGVILSKNNGKKKRRALKQEKLLPEPNINCDRHAEFVNKISDLEEYKENDIIEQDDWIIEVKEERNNSNESSREN